jgi:hypothetical protein
MKQAEELELFTDVDMFDNKPIRKFIFLLLCLASPGL